MTLRFLEDDIDSALSSGTGTKVGDPIEAGAIGRCFGESGIYLGAVCKNLLVERLSY